jgi:hypothetical protein
MLAQYAQKMENVKPCAIRISLKTQLMKPVTPATHSAEAATKQARMAAISALEVAPHWFTTTSSTAIALARVACTTMSQLTIVKLVIPLVKNVTVPLT